jgi:hypothetical protein
MIAQPISDPLPNLLCLQLSTLQNKSHNNLAILLNRQTHNADPGHIPDEQITILDLLM